VNEISQNEINFFLNLRKNICVLKFKKMLMFFLKYFNVFVKTLEKLTN